ncbi:hypothetical protein [Ornithinimicrobium pekingense]|uniref:Uncharacterized protein n=1 Tax=Ornithinimicrobium pekingense TaxID=384677 RepID=A0ABQ2F792_9MICO|nr:hypothetical protein [Ornithinimicrobium pekingense]GGK67641.1 hypothetical protein GCM10011509_15020 [Ornithinimicrobium pekingense]
MTTPTDAGAGPALPHPPRWHERHARALGIAGAAAAAGMTALWLVVVPERAAVTGGLQSWALRWGHPASWACLTGVGLTVATGAPRRWRDVLAWAALGCYAVFLVALVL